jgi:hypothetical protein
MGYKEIVTSSGILTWAFVQERGFVALSQQIIGERGRSFIIEAYHDHHGKFRTLRINVPHNLNSPWDSNIYGYGTNGQRHKMGSSFPVNDPPISVESFLLQSKLFTEEQLPETLDIQKTGEALMVQMKRGDVSRPQLFELAFASPINIQMARASFWAGSPAGNNAYE